MTMIKRLKEIRSEILDRIAPGGHCTRLDRASLLAMIEDALDAAKEEATPK